MPFFWKKEKGRQVAFLFLFFDLWFAWEQDLGLDDAAALGCEAVEQFG